MNPAPDPVELASDELRRILAAGDGDTIAQIRKLMEVLPEARRFWGAVRLLGDHMADALHQNGHVRFSVYDSFEASVAKQAANELIADIRPEPGMELPIFRSGSPRYTLERIIAAGGFGSVWSATSTSDGSRVAIKTPWTSDTATSDWQKRVDILRHEAETLNRLDHPGVVSCIEFFTDSGDVSYLVTEALDGGDLASQAKPIELHKAIRWASEIAEALDYLRTKSVVHRDITPGNLALNTDDRIKIIDFGLAVPVGERRDHDNERAGTLGYMPPEQIFGTSRELGCRSDATSVGAILYELVTGTSPFDDESTEGMAVGWMSKQLEERAEDERIPAALRPILRRCFAYHQEHRFATSGQLAKELQRVRGFSRLQAWWAGRSSGVAIEYSTQTDAALSMLRNTPAERLDANNIAMALLQGVGVIEELDRLGRLLAATATEIPASPELLDPRRRIRTPVRPDELPQVDEGLRTLIHECNQRASLARKAAGNADLMAVELFDLACLVHSLPVRAAFPVAIDELTAKVGFPEHLVLDLRAAIQDDTGADRRRHAIAAYDAHAESVLE